MGTDRRTPGPCTMRKFDAVDGCFILISDANGDLFAKAYDKRRALLIAAAPDQNEALRGVAVMLNTELRAYESEPWARKVRAALAKAGG